MSVRNESLVPVQMIHLSDAIFTHERFI
jgi:hypothetical protein